MRKSVPPTPDDQNRAGKMLRLESRMREARRVTHALGRRADDGPDRLDDLASAIREAADCSRILFTPPDLRDRAPMRRLLDRLTLLPFLSLERWFFGKPRAVDDRIQACLDAAAGALRQLNHTVVAQNDRIAFLAERVDDLQGQIASLTDAGEARYGARKPELASR